MEVDFIQTADVKWWEKCSRQDAVLKFYQGVKIPFALPGKFYDILEGLILASYIAYKLK